MFERIVFFEIIDVLFIISADQEALAVPSTSRGLFRPWDVKNDDSTGLQLLAEAVENRGSVDSDVEMVGGGIVAPPIGRSAVRLISVGDNPILSSTDPGMATDDDFRHIFSDLSEIDLDEPTSEVQNNIIEIDTFLSNFDYPDGVHSE